MYSVIQHVCYLVIVSVSHSGSMMLLFALLFDSCLMRVGDHYYSNYITWKRGLTYFAFLYFLQHVTIHFGGIGLAVIFCFIFLFFYFSNHLHFHSHAKQLFSFSPFCFSFKYFFKAVLICYTESFLLSYYLKPASIYVDKMYRFQAALQ